MQQGPLKLVTPAASSVLTLTEAKAHLRVEQSFVDDDSLITALITTAEDYVQNEVYGNRQLINATWDLPLSDWWTRLDLPRPPLQSVTSISYYDSGGTLQTLSSAVYVVTTATRMPGFIELAPTQTWPTVQSDRLYPITVRFVCGYGSGASSVPRVLKHAMLLFLAELYNSRESGALGVAAGGTKLASTLAAVRWLCESEGWGSYA